MVATFPLAVVLRGIDQLSGPLGKAEAGLSRFAKRAVSAGRKLTVGLTVPTVALGVAVITAAARFESGMLNVQALTGKTAAEIAKLERQAIDLGSSTAFSATQASEAMGLLSAKGFSVNEVFASTPSILNLAAASTVELAEAARIASGVLKGQLKDEKEIVHVSNVLADVSTKTAATLTSLGFGFADVGPLAARMKIEFEELTAVLGLLSDVQFEGSKGGTAMRGALARLLVPTRATAEALGRLGIKKEDLIDSAGNIISFTNTIRELERVSATAPQILEIFGVKAGPAMAALVGIGSEAVEELRIKLGDSSEGLGRAAEIAELKMSGATGAIKEFQSAVEGLAIAIGGAGLLEWFTEATRAATVYVQILRVADPELLRTGTIIAAVAAAMGPLIIGAGLVAGALVKMTTLTQIFWPLLARVGAVLVSTVIPAVWSFTAALLANPIGLAIVAIVALGAAIIAVVKNWDSIVAAFHRVKDAIHNVAGRAFDWLKDKISAAIDIVPDWMITLFQGSPTGRIIRAITGPDVGPGGQPTGASADRAEAERRTAARDAGSESKVLVDFTGVPQGTRITQDDSEIPVDLALGVSLAPG